ncbi:MAG: hypothetical protein AAGH64_09150 [Planctomycetota bacterium]
MQRDGADPTNMQVSDFLCDFCGRAWDGAFPLVEGHRGSLICGNCLTIAYTDVIHMGLDAAPTGATCTMCLEERADPMWASPVRDDAYACKRCIRQSGTRLDKDPDWPWTRPGKPDDPTPDE